MTASEVREFAFTIPPGTPVGAPYEQDMTFPARDVAGVQITVPPGANGTVGFALANSGIAVLPITAGQWIVTSAQNIELDMTGYINSGSWQAIGYNTGYYPHTIYIRFLLNLPAGPAATVLASAVGQSADTGPGAAGAVTGDTLAALQVSSDLLAAYT